VNCAVSIDLDGVDCYYKIHGLTAPPAELDGAILERALPRARDLFARHGIRATWFVIGKDVDGKPARIQALRELAAAGDELGNHSYNHRYELARLPADEVEWEIAECDRVLRAIAPVRGFRAPGYDVSPAVLDALARRGYRYDSSIFPAPGYYAAKAVVMAGLAATRRRSGAVLTNPRALAAPADPYRPSMTAPWRRGQAPLVELPIAVTPWLRVPAIGTSLLVAPAWLSARIIARMAGRVFFNLELHGIDFADADKDGIPGELALREPALKIPIDEKLSRLDRALEAIAKRWEFATLASVASAVQRDA
jgi:peptidoglycan/xylan/chitin deacetylase (PgdA/CDA1 family)